MSRVLSTAAAAIACALFAAPAGAAKDDDLGNAGRIKYVRDTITVKGSTSTARSAVEFANCPKGYKVLSGGGTIKGPAAESTLGFSTIASQRSWATGGWHNAGSNAAKLNVYGVCTRAKKVSNVRESSSVGAAPAEGTQEAVCEKGHAVGGGVLTMGDTTDWLLNTSYPENSLGDNWRVYIFHASGSASSILVDVICLGGKTPTYRAHSADVPGGPATLRAKCPAGHPVVGGGFFIAGTADEGHALSSRPYDGKDSDKVPDDGWEARTYNGLGTQNEARTYAVCLG